MISTHLLSVAIDKLPCFQKSHRLPILVPDRANIDNFWKVCVAPLYVFVVAKVYPAIHPVFFPVKFCQKLIEFPAIIDCAISKKYRSWEVNR
jgi:hypothetical protein